MFLNSRRSDIENSSIFTHWQLTLKDNIITKIIFAVISRKKQILIYLLFIMIIYYVNTDMMNKMDLLFELN